MGDGGLHLFWHGISVLHCTSLDGPVLDLLITGSCVLLSLDGSSKAFSVLISTTVTGRPALN